MVTQWSLSEFAALGGRHEDEVERWRAAGLLDPAGSGHFDDLDLARLVTIRAGEAEGYGPEALPEAIRAGAVRPFLSEYRQSGALQAAVGPLLDRVVQCVHHQHPLRATVEDACGSVPGTACAGFCSATVRDGGARRS